MRIPWVCCNNAGPCLGVTNEEEIRSTMMGFEEEFPQFEFLLGNKQAWDRFTGWLGNLTDVHIVCYGEVQMPPKCKPGAGRGEVFLAQRISELVSGSPDVKGFN